MDWKRTLKFSLIYFVVSTLALLALEFFVLGGFGPREAAYSDFLKALAERRVASAEIGPTSVIWTVTNDPMPYVSTRTPGVEDSALIGQLQQAGATFSGFVERNWLGGLLSWLLPILLILGVWGFMLPRLPGQTQAIDDEIRVVVETNYQRARALLAGCQGLLQELAVELKQREEISGAELRKRIEAWRMRPACPDMERTLGQPHVEQAALSSLATMS